MTMVDNAVLITTEHGTACAKLTTQYVKLSDGILTKTTERILA